MLIWLIPIVPLLQATLHLLSSIDVSASMSQYAAISLSDRSAPGRSGRQAWIQQRLIIFCIQLRMLQLGQGRDVYVYVCGVDVFLCMWASVCCFRGCVDRMQRMCLACSVFPALVCTSPPPQLCTSYPPALRGKISSNLTAFHAGGLQQRIWDDRADGSPFVKLFLTLLIDKITKINLDSCDCNMTPCAMFSVFKIE